MRMKNFSAVLVSTLTATLFVFVLGEIAAAQGRYSNQYSRADVDTIIRNVEERADEFRRDFYAELERSNLGAGQERVYRNQVTDFENASDRLRRNFDSDNNWWQSRNQVRNVITNAQPLNSTMNSIAFRRRIERQWNQLRNAVNRLADTYDLPGIAGGGWSGGGRPGNPGAGRRPPDWAQGDFYSNYPAISLTINRNGNVMVVRDGMSYQGTYTGDGFYMNDHNHRVTRSGNGIRTYNTTTGETVNYTRGTGGGGPIGDGVRPPNWAEGTFRSNYPRITLTIGRNGRVTAVRDGETFYGTYRSGGFMMNGHMHTVTRRGNGIRTYNQTTGETVDYRP